MNDADSLTTEDKLRNALDEAHHWMHHPMMGAARTDPAWPCPDEIVDEAVERVVNMWRAWKDRRVDERARTLGYPRLMGSGCSFKTENHADTCPGEHIDPERRCQPSGPLHYQDWWCHYHLKTLTPSYWGIDAERCEACGGRGWVEHVPPDEGGE